MTIKSTRDMINREHTLAGARRQRTEENQAFLERLQELMDEIETRNLGSDRRVPDALWRRIQELADQLPVDPPRDLWRAQTTTRLHDVMLRWQDALLDHITPDRRRYADRHD